MRRQNRERWHSIDRKRLRDSGRERLRKERDTTLRLSTAGEEVAFVAVVAREEWRRAESAATVWAINLVVEETLDVMDGQQVLAVHRDNDSIPDL